MAAESSGGHEAIVETVEATDAAKAAGLAIRLVDDVDAVATTVTARYALGLTVEADAHACKTELTHQTLLSCGGRTGHAHRCSALHAAMAARARRSKAWRLERQNLVRGELLLVKSGLLTLKGLDLLLNGNLNENLNERNAQIGNIGNKFTCSAMTPRISPLLSLRR